VKTQHTPGPWEIDGFYQGAFEVIAPKASVTRGRLVICSRGQHELREREFQANARLIAAAPDLLEALKEFVGAVDAGTTFADSSVVDVARAAIAKARGEA